jgi:6-phosphogluconolactonase
MSVLRMLAAIALALGAGALMSACSDGSAPTEPSINPSFQQAGNVPHTAAGSVYLMSNAVGGNEVLVFRRASDGSLTPDASVATGGTGSGGGLGNQGAVMLSKDGRWLFVVNPGSDDLSVFRIRPERLQLTDVVGSGGDMPVSVAVHGSLVYVLNAGAPNNVSGFSLRNDGSLTPLAGSTRPLSAASTGPAQVGFTPRGDVLVVTEKGTNTITTYAVGSDGLLSAPNSQGAAGQTPFGFGFDHRGLLIVSEAFGGAPDASTVSSYRLNRDGDLTVVDPVVPTTETAACWIAVSENGRFAYTTNTGSGSVTGFDVGHAGKLEILDADGQTGIIGGGSSPIDAAFSQGGRYLYVLSSGIPAVSVFRLDAHGGLTLLPAAGAGLPPGANGMAAR